MLGRIVDAQRGVARLGGGDDCEASVADGDLRRVGALGNVGHGIREDVLLRVAREAVDHREVALAHPLRRDREVLFRPVGDVVGRVGRRLVILRGVDAEEGEVARVARPDPVVGVAAELADRRGRRRHEAHVVELLVDEQELLVAVVHLFNGSLVIRPFGLGRADDLLGRLARREAVGDLLHPDEELHVQLLVGQLLGARAGPESVGQVVVLDGRVGLDGVVAAVVVGQQQPFGRDQLARAAAVEEYDGILHRGAVDRVDVFGREAESFGAHVVDARRDEAREPHALVGEGGQQRQRRQQCQQGSFHRIITGR